MSLTAAQKAYGCLWRDMRVAPTALTRRARQELLRSLTHSEQRAAIEWAICEFGPVTDSEVRGIE